MLYSSLLIGDNKQPNGAAPQQTQQLILKKSLALGAGLRASKIVYKGPDEYFRDFTVFSAPLFIPTQTP